MAYRRNGYLYRSRRDGGRVTTEYLGRGPLAEARAALDAAAARAREERRRAEREERARQRKIDATIDRVLERARLLTRAVLLASGYHTHKGTWRKARDGTHDDGDAPSGRQD